MSLLLALSLLAACGGGKAPGFNVAFIPPAPLATASPAPLPATPATATADPLPAPAAASTLFLPALTLEGIFVDAPLLPSGLEPERLRTLIATGDVIPARLVDAQIRAHGNDFRYPFAATAELLAAADVTLINLEAPLLAACPLHRSGFTFCGQAGFVDGLLYAGVDVAGLENNHIGNYGRQGVSATVELLRQHDIDYADRSTLAVRGVRGLRFGFLAYNGVGEYIDRPAMTAAIREADAQVDLLVVAFHWGREYVSLPQVAPGIAPDDPVEIGHLAVEAGADLVIGNHPHWVQAVELYRGKLIAYAHGNFIFDQMWSLETRQGVVGRYTFYDDQLVRVEYLPLLIEDYAQPRLLAGEEAQAILGRMYQASLALADKLAPQARASSSTSP